MNIEKMGMGLPEKPKKESKLEEEKHGDNKGPDREPINSPDLFDLYRNSDDASRYKSGLEDIKKVAERISLKLYELGVTDFPPESKLGEAYITANKINRNYQDIEQAQSAMKRISSLIFESDGFKDASEKWAEEKIEDLKSYSESIKQTLIEAQAMLDEADEKGFSVDNESLNSIIDNFERQMVQLRGDVLDIKTEIANSGLKMTRDDMEARLKKMEQK